MADEIKKRSAELCHQTPTGEKTLGRVIFLAIALALFGMVPLGGLLGLPS